MDEGDSDSGFVVLDYEEHVAIQLFGSLRGRDGDTSRLDGSFLALSMLILMVQGFLGSRNGAARLADLPTVQTLLQIVSQRAIFLSGLHFRSFFSSNVAQW